jgi:hypothetical protein
VEDERWHTNPSHRVLRHQVDGSCQLVVPTVAQVAKALEVSVLRLDEPEPRIQSEWAQFRVSNSRG